MHEANLTVAAVALAAITAPQAHDAPLFRLQEERISIEYNVTRAEAVIAMEAEAEVALRGLEIRAPDGELLFTLSAAAAAGPGFKEFRLGSAEIGPTSFAKMLAEGVYELRGRTAGGQLVLGEALLSHGLLRPPVVLYPVEGARDVPTDLVVSWVPEAGVAGYHVVLEQGENDGLSLDLPGGASSFQVPPGILAHGTESHVEVGAIAPNGNRTLVEISFTTR